MKTNIAATNFEDWIRAARLRIPQIRAELRTMFGNTMASDKLVEELEFLEFIIIDHDKLSLEQTKQDERLHLLDGIHQSMQQRTSGCLNTEDKTSQRACLTALAEVSLLRDRLRSNL